MHQRPYSPDHQELPREVVRRACAALLFAVADGQLHIRRERHVVFPGVGLFRQSAAVAARLARNHGRGLHHLCAVPDILAEEAAQGGRNGLTIFGLY